MADVAWLHWTQRQRDIIRQLNDAEKETAKQRGKVAQSLEQLQQRIEELQKDQADRVGDSIMDTVRETRDDDK